MGDSPTEWARSVSYVKAPSSVLDLRRAHDGICIAALREKRIHAAPRRESSRRSPVRGRLPIKNEHAVYLAIADKKKMKKGVIAPPPVYYYYACIDLVSEGRVQSETRATSARRVDDGDSLRELAFASRACRTDGCENP